MRRGLLTIFMMIVVLGVNAQKETHVWHFGDSAGINFNTGSAVAISPVPLSTSEGCASIADSAGGLLFYTDGLRVWDRSHTVMPNGAGLMGNTSSTQSAVVVPKPGTTTRYFLFTVSQQASVNGFRYSEVDMTLNGGLGDIISGTKNTPLITPTTEKVCAVSHTNGQDIWVVTHNWNNDEWLAYLVTAAGVSGTPVSSNAGAVHTGGSGNTIGQLKFSANGKKLAYATYTMNTIEVLDFDASTGIVSNALNLPSGNLDYGVEFSPDGSKVYFGTWAFPAGQLYQFDLSSGVPATIIASQIRIDSSAPAITSLQLGPDKKIYVGRYNVDSLGVINDPDMAGTACNYDMNGFALAPGSNSLGGLPNFVASFFGVSDIFANSFCFGDSTHFTFSSSSQIDSIYWDFGDPLSASNNSTDEAPAHLYTDTGRYVVTAFLDIGFGVDTIYDTVQIHSYPVVDLGNDSTLCVGTTLALGSFEPGNYLWSTGDTVNNVLVNTPGLVWLEVTANGCTSRDTMNLYHQAPPFIDAGPDLVSECYPVMIEAAATGVNTYTWTPPAGLSDPGALNPTAQPVAPTWYHLTATDDIGCTSIDSVFIDSDLSSGLEMPNAFSPNGDGFNDVYKPVHKCFEEATYRIANRYGKVIFESNDLDQGWDGTFKGKPQPVGTYIYHLTGESSTGEPIEIKGNITLIK